MQESDSQLIWNDRLNRTEAIFHEDYTPNSFWNSFILQSALKSNNKKKRFSFAEDMLY